VVHLQDAADDIEHVLRALYGRGYYVRRVPATTIPFPIVSAFLRLGKKYEIKELYEDAKACLLSDFPDAWMEWHSRSKSIVSPSRKALLINVVNLAQDIGLRRVLPAAFYACLTQCSLQEIQCGVQEEGEVTALSPRNRAICISAWQPFQSCAIRTFSWLDPANFPKQCQSKNSCTEHRYALMGRKFYPAPSCEPLEYFDSSWNANVCSVCSDYAKSNHGSNRFAAWSQLPSLFSLPAWHELSVEDEGVLASTK